ncbi:MAG: pirin family protein [Pseudomonadota bacterium]
MNAINKAVGCSQSIAREEAALVSEPLTGAKLTIGTGFKARSFKAKDIGEAMDPLVMVDHYVMTEPTFGAHPHAGMSAVSLLFENSEGLFHNRDSLGNDFDLQPGDLYWLKAGSGAIHDESPRANTRTHALQVFVNVPQAQRFEAPNSLLVRAADMPVLRTAEHWVKVALGETNNVRGAVSPSIPMTVLDGTIYAGGHFAHQSGVNQGVWIHAVQGSLDIVIDKRVSSITTGQALAIGTDRGAEITIRNPLSKPAHFALFDGAKINEHFIHDGPFVMGSAQQITDINAAYKAGQLGGIPNNH